MSEILVLTNGEKEFQEFLRMRPCGASRQYIKVEGVQDLSRKEATLVRFGTYYLREDYEPILKEALRNKFCII